MAAKPRRGLKAFKNRKNQKGGGRKNDTYLFRLSDGEEAPMRFLGMFREPISDKKLDKISKKKSQLEYIADVFGVTKLKDETLLDACKRRMREGEPFIFISHWIPKIQRPVTCADDDIWDDVEGVDGCVPCAKRAEGGQWKKKLGFPVDKYGYTVVDLRMIHKVEKGDSENQYETCTLDELGKCKWCKRENEDGPVFPAIMRGRRRLECGKQRAGQIMALNDKLGRKCLFCNGRLVSDGWSCGSCGEVFEDIDAEGIAMRCPECGHKGLPTELVRHKKTPSDEHEAVRGSLSDCVIIATRDGSDKDTVYTYDAEDFDAGPTEEEWEKWGGMIDWMEELKPEKSKKVAAKLGLREDPLSEGKVGGSSYDDDDDEDDDDEDDELFDE